MEGFVARLPLVVIQLVAFAIAIAWHESAHGLMAEKLGDPTARMLGRISLNPIRHIDPIGTVLFPLMLAAIGAPVLGWAKPTPFIPRNLKNHRWGPAMVAAAGPLSNLILVVVAVIVLLGARAVIPQFKPLLNDAISFGPTAVPGILAPILVLLFFIAYINIVLAVFNLMPIPPLDGGHLVEAVLPARYAMAWAQLSRYGMLVLFALLWTGFFGWVLRPFVTVLGWLLLS